MKYISKLMSKVKDCALELSCAGIIYCGGVFGLDNLDAINYKQKEKENIKHSQRDAIDDRKRISKGYRIIKDDNDLDPKDLLSGDGKGKSKTKYTSLKDVVLMCSADLKDGERKVIHYNDADGDASALLYVSNEGALKIEKSGIEEKISYLKNNEGVEKTIHVVSSEYNLVQGEKYQPSKQSLTSKLKTFKEQNPELGCAYDILKGAWDGAVDIEIQTSNGPKDALDVMTTNKEKQKIEKIAKNYGKKVGKYFSKKIKSKTMEKLAKKAATKLATKLGKKCIPVAGQLDTLIGASKGAYESNSCRQVVKDAYNKAKEAIKSSKGPGDYKCSSSAGNLSTCETVQNSRPEKQKEQSYAKGTTVPKDNRIMRNKEDRTTPAEKSIDKIVDSARELKRDNYVMQRPEPKVIEKPEPKVVERPEPKPAPRNYVERRPTPKPKTPNPEKIADDIVKVEPRREPRVKEFHHEPKDYCTEKELREIERDGV